MKKDTYLLLLIWSIIILNCNFAYSQKTNSTNSNTSSGVSNRNVETQSYANLLEAVKTIGTSEKLLNVNSDIDCATALTVPKTLTLEFTGGGKIVRQAGCALVIYGQIKADRTNIFSGFVNTNQLKLLGANDVVYPEWFGAVGDNVTDDSNAIQLMFDAVDLTSGYGATYKTSGKFRFGAGRIYYSSKEIHVRSSSDIEGVGGKGWFSATIIRFADNKKGFVFEGYSTEREARNASMTQGSAVLKANLNFSAADVGKNIIVFGAGINQNAPNLTAKILSVQSATQATLSTNAYQTATNQSAFFLSDLTSQWSKISDIYLLGGTHAAVLPTHTIDIDGNKITRLTGEALDPYRGFPEGTTFTMGQSEWTIGILPTVSMTGNLASGSDTVTLTSGTVDNSFLFAGVTINYVNYSVKEVVSSTQFKLDRRSAASSLTGTSINITRRGLSGYRFNAYGNAAKTPSNIVRKTANAVFENWLVGATIHINRVDYLIDSVVNNYTVTIKNMDGTPAIVPYFEGDAAITALAPRRNVVVRFNNFHGIEANAQVEIRNVYISNFSGSGINFDSGKASGLLGNEPNVNNANVTRNFMHGNKGHGIYLRGTNSNQISIKNNDSNVNRGWGFYDTSFLGNVYEGNHSAGNENGGSYSVLGGVNQSTYTGEYGEGGQPSNILSSQSSWFGGLPGNGFSAEYNKGATMMASGGEGKTFLTSGIKTTSLKPSESGGFAANNAHTTVQIGQGGNPALPVLMGFGNSDEAGGNPPHNPALSYVLTYANGGQPAPGWYALQYGEQQRNDNSTDYTVLAFSGAAAAEGAKQLWMPNGFYFGRNSDGVTRSKFTVTALGLSLDKNFKANTFQLDSDGTRPVCGATTRLTIWVSKGGTGAADVPQMCLKNADESFSWRNITTN